MVMIPEVKGARGPLRRLAAGFPHGTGVHPAGGASSREIGHNSRAPRLTFRFAGCRYGAASPPWGRTALSAKGAACPRERAEPTEHCNARFQFLRSSFARRADAGRDRRSSCPTAQRPFPRILRWNNSASAPKNESANGMPRETRTPHGPTPSSRLRANRVGPTETSHRIAAAARNRSVRATGRLARGSIHVGRGTAGAPSTPISERPSRPTSTTRRKGGSRCPPGMPRGLARRNWRLRTHGRWWRTPTVSKIGRSSRLA